MKDILKYKNFIGCVHYSTEDETFYGKIEGINDLITFEGETVKDLKKSFIDAVDDYIFLCEENEIDPYKSFKGSFNIRISPDLHKMAYQLATLEGISLNQFVQEAITHELNMKQKEFEYAR